MAEESNEEAAARSKSKKQQLQMLEQMRKQHQLQSQLARMTSSPRSSDSSSGRSANSSTPSSHSQGKGFKYNRSNVSSIYNGNSEETAAVVAAISAAKQQNKSKQKQRTKQITSNRSMAEEDDELGKLVSSLSLNSSNASPTGPSALSNTRNKSSNNNNSNRAFLAAAKSELDGLASEDEDDDEEELWEQARISDIFLKQNRKKELIEEVELDRSTSNGSDSNGSNEHMKGSISEEEDDDEEEAVDGDSEKGSESAEDYSDDEDEGEDGYRPGGYHPVKIGEVYNQRYIVVKKLGWGHFSTVWMVRDKEATDNDKFLALKVQKSADHYTDAAMDEVQLLDCVAKERKRCEAALKISGTGDAFDSDGVTLRETYDFSRHTATIYDSFFHRGPHGRHMCMVFEMLGCNLLSVIKAYNYRGIPIPAVKAMIRGICKGLDFLHRKCHIIHTDLKPENVLLHFSPDLCESSVDESGISLGSSSIVTESSQQTGLSIVELEKALEDPSISSDERRRLKNRLKKKRQKERRKVVSQMEEVSEAEVGVISAADQRSMTDASVAGLFVNEINNDNTSQGPSQSTKKVLDQLKHSSFVSENFSPQLYDRNRWDDAVGAAKISSLSSEAAATIFRTFCDVAELTFVLRAFGPEGEVADNLSAALGIKWERSSDKNFSREWRGDVAFNMPIIDTDDIGGKLGSAFKLSQWKRNNLNDGEKEVLSESVRLVGCNICASDNMTFNLAHSYSPAADANQDYKCLPYSAFTLKFSAASAVIVLSVLEERIPGLIFLSYKSDDGSPSLDEVVFGNNRRRICNYPLLKDDVDESERKTCLLGFDLRMVKGFNSRPSVGEYGAASFDLSGSSMDNVSNWWSARKPVHARVKSFLCKDAVKKAPTSPLTKKKILSEMQADTKIKQNPVTPSPRVSSQLKSSPSSPTPNTNPPDLKDAETLARARAVVVDLGNACWTHRHFSEDIQTRQYRCPEVLIGSKYDTPADMWSLGCITFELLTGDLLFDPRAGDDYDRDEDHLAMFQELLGKMPKRLALSGKQSRNFFNKKGELKHIQHLKFWPIHEVLHEKYHFSEIDSREIAKFMLPLLEFHPANRATALIALEVIGSMMTALA
eukprot:CAMPEP_0196828266 /NCGR_PEP_ID=MMETSP1362-20130617/94587_1 /TAXON_ID=163516 /ORGANISM="Leptocylindrus danicus, Strain CCMP1856" /LENGTH=1110 /DNA_ID=CAMNT_0042208939 /DNA_START=165 /DNA_END=3498 /DNA_ORIENTATION=+